MANDKQPMAEEIEPVKQDVVNSASKGVGTNQNLFKSLWSTMGKILLIIVLLCGVGAVAAYYLMQKHSSAPVKPVTVKYNNLYPLPELKLAIKNDDKSFRYLLIGLTLKLSSADKIDDYHKREDEILDVLHTYFSSIYLNNFSSSLEENFMTPVGLERIRQDILDRLKVAFPNFNIESILFRKLILQ